MQPYLQPGLPLSTSSALWGKREGDDDFGVGDRQDLSFPSPCAARATPLFSSSACLGLWNNPSPWTSPSPCKLGVTIPLVTLPSAFAALDSSGETRRKNVKYSFCSKEGLLNSD